MRSAARSASARSSRSTLFSSAPCRSSAGAGRPVTALTTRSRSRLTCPCSAAHPLAGADELLPAGQHLAAQQRAAADALVDRRRGPRRRRRPPRRAAPSAAACCSSTAVGDARRPAAPGCPARRSASAGRRRPGRPGRRRARAASRAAAPTWSSGSRPSASGRSSTTNSRAPASPARGQHPGQVGGHLRGRLGRHPVEDDGQRGAPLLRRPQQVPRARRRRSGPPS